MSIQKKLRRQCGVPALSNRPALAKSGTKHCTRSAKVVRDWLPRGSNTEAPAYKTSRVTQPLKHQTILRDSTISSRLPIVGRCWMEISTRFLANSETINEG